MTRHAFNMGAILLASLCPLATLAEQKQVHVPIILEVAGTCAVDTSGIGGFGQWPAGSPDLRGVALGSLAVSCPSGLAYLIGADQGANFSGGQRHLSDGVNAIAYSLWLDAAASQEWGDGGLGAVEPGYTETYSTAPALSGTGNGGARSVSVWGGAAVSGAPVGRYQDDVTITIVW